MFEEEVHEFRRVTQGMDESKVNTKNYLRSMGLVDCLEIITQGKFNKIKLVSFSVL